MNSSDLYDRFRADVFDTRQPYLWSDLEVYSYMDAAQKQFCRRAGGILDSTSDLTQLSFAANQVWVATSPLILAVQRAQRLSDFQRVDVLSVEELTRLSDGNDYGTQRQFRLDNQTGEVRYAINNLEVDKLRLLRIPKAADTIALTVYRLPLKSISDADQKFEIAEQHHEYLLWGMKALAYLKQDAETRDDGKAQRFQQQFLAYCEQARQERERREHKPRSMTYGGI